MHNVYCIDQSLWICVRSMSAGLASRTAEQWKGAEKWKCSTGTGKRGTTSHPASSRVNPDVSDAYGRGRINLLATECSRLPEKATKPIVLAAKLHNDTLKLLNNWITQCYLQLHQCLPLPRKRSLDGATSVWYSRYLIATYYSYIDRERRKGWVDLVGWPIADRVTHISGYPPSVDRAQDS